MNSFSASCRLVPLLVVYPIAEAVEILSRKSARGNSDRGHMALDETRMETKIKMKRMKQQRKVCLWIQFLESDKINFSLSPYLPDSLFLSLYLPLSPLSDSQLFVDLKKLYPLILDHDNAIRGNPSLGQTTSYMLTKWPYLL